VLRREVTTDPLAETNNNNDVETSDGPDGLAQNMLHSWRNIWRPRDGLAFCGERHQLAGFGTNENAKANHRLKCCHICFYY